MTKRKIIIPYIIAFLCAGFACTQKVFVFVVDWFSRLSMKLDYGWFTVTIVILFIAWCGYQLIANWKKYKYNDALIATLVFFTITTLYYRFVNDGYDYVPLVRKVAYVDVLWVMAVAFVVESLVNKKATPDSPSESESAILLDSPVESPKEDKFDYYSEAHHIATTISQLPESRAISVAVLSPWGNGKTSFVNLIKYAIKQGNDGESMFDHIIIEFNPRQSKNISSIQEDFFKALTESFPDGSKIRNKISDYIENIGIQDLHPVAKLFAGILKESKKDATDDVNEALDYLGKRLIVFIDDFDRLTDVEIIEVLKLIDNNAAFRHTIFITAYDETAVANALKKYESANGIAYIDKFFTLRFHLPLRTDLSIVNELYQLLMKKIDDDIDLLPIFNKRYRIIAECVRNLREVKNFCNMFQIDYAFNSKHEISFEEYFLLELMKFRYYDDYFKLFKREYIENASLFQVHNADATYTLKEKYSRDKQGNEPKEEQPRSIDILRCLFSDHRQYGDYSSTIKPSFRSVQYVRYFDMYFTNRNYGHVQAEQLESLYTIQNNEDIANLYKQSIRQNANSDIVDYLRYQDWQDIAPKGTLTKEETFKQFVRLVFLYSAISNNNDTYMHSLQMQLLYKPNFDDKGYNGMTEQSYHDFLLEVIYNHHNPEFIPLAFLMTITNTLTATDDEGTKEADNFLLKQDEVKKNNFDLFKSYIESHQQYSPTVSSVYRLCLDRIENSRLVITKEANEIMREFLYNDKSNEYLKGFLIFNKESDRHITITFKDPFFKQIFPIEGKEDLFEKYVKETLPESDNNRIEILAYLIKYRNAGSDHTGYYFVKKDNPNPSNMEIIEGLEF